MRYPTSARNLSTPRVLIAALAVVLVSLLLVAPAARAGDVRLSISIGIPLYYSGYDSQGYLYLSTGHWGGGHGHYYGKPHYRYRTHHRHYLWPQHPYGQRHLHYGKPHHPYGKDHRFYGSHRGHSGMRHQHFDRQQRPNYRGYRR